MTKNILKSTINAEQYKDYKIAETRCHAVYELDEPIVLTLNNSNAAQVECTHCYWNNMAGVPEFGYLVFNSVNNVYEIGRFTVRAYDGTTGCCKEQQKEKALALFRNAVKKGNVSINGLRTERFANIKEQKTVFAPEI